MSKVQSVVGDFSVCRDAANQFFNISEWCSEKDVVEFLYDGLYPYAVNIAFSCELYLKAIQIWESSKDEFKKGHKLKELFDSLNLNTKNQLKSSFDSKYHKSIEDFLSENSDVFVDWRYALEKEVSIDYSGFDVLAGILYDYVNNLK